MEKGRDIQVSIIGGGLVGSLCACILGNRGVRVKLHEVRDDPRQLEFAPWRCYNMVLSARGLSALRLAGLEEEVVQRHGIRMRGRMLHAEDGRKTPVPYDKEGKCIYSVERRYLLEMLLTAAERNSNVEIHFKSKFLDCDLKSGKSNILCADGVVKEEIGDLLIGCDGAHSSVRKQILKTPRLNYSQTYVDVGYIRLRIPATDSGEFAMEETHQHAWPRRSFMMVAFPNQDSTFTVTLVMPFSMFNSIKTPQQLIKFFSDNFADVIPLIGREKLIKDFFRHPPSSLVSIKCNPHHVEDKILLMGDAAHAMVPFYGQGMNAGFEDCEVLAELLETHNFDLKAVLPAYTEYRQRDTEVMCDLSMCNYQELSQLLTVRKVMMRKLDHLLYTIFPQTWVPIQTLVVFTKMRYSQCILRKNKQDKILTSLMCSAAVTAFSIIALFARIYL